MRNREFVQPAVQASGREGDDNQAEPDIDLADYVAVVWRHRIVLITGILAVMALVGGVVLLSPRKYEATATVAINPRNTTEGGPPAVTLANLRPLVQNPTFADGIIRDFKLEQRPYALSSSTFLSEVLVLEDVRDTNLLRFRVRLPDAAAAAAVANGVVEKTLELTRQMKQGQLAQLGDLAKEELQQAAARLQEAEQALIAFQSSANVELLRQEVDNLLGARADLFWIDVDIQGHRAKLARAEEELASRSKLRAAGKSEIVDSVYEKLDQLVVETRARLAELERKRATLAGRGRVPQAPQLAQLYQREAELSRRELDLDVAQRTYQDVAARYETVRLQAASRGGQLHVVEPAQPPGSPLPRRLVAKLMMAAVIGLVLGVLAAFLREAMAR